VGDLAFARASHESLYGTIISDWKIREESFSWNVTIPPNTTATVFFPANDRNSVTEGGMPADQSEGVKFLRVENGVAVYTIGSGSYSFLSAGLVRITSQ
jgi:alpha-L-rhamnosidase